MRPTPQAVRDAAEALKQAIDAHLFAVETRLGDSDTAVELAYRTIRTVTERYDRLMLEAYHEVTPFTFADHEDEQGHCDELGLPTDQSFELPPVVSLCVRRDYAVVDHDEALAQGRQAHAAAQKAGLPLFEQQSPQSLPAALYAMFQVAGVDGLDSAAGQAGLQSLGGAIWFVAGNDPQLVDVHTALITIDPEKVIFRIHEVPEGLEQPEQQADEDDSPYYGQEDPLGLGLGPSTAATSTTSTGASSASQPTPRPLWSFETGSLPAVGSVAAASAPARPQPAPQPAAYDDPLDTTQAFTWSDDPSWASPPAEPNPYQPGLQWERGLFREESAPESGWEPSWDPDDPLSGPPPRRRRTD